MNRAVEKGNMIEWISGGTYSCCPAERDFQQNSRGKPRPSAGVLHLRGKGKKYSMGQEHYKPTF